MKALFAASIAVFVVAFGGFALLFFLESRTQGKIDEAEMLLTTEKTVEETELEQEVFLARARLQDFSTLAAQRKNMLSAFSFLESTVHPDVTFLAVSVNTALQVMQLKGQAKSFAVLDEQLAVLQAKAEQSSLSLTDLRLGQTGGVDFQMEIQFPAAFLQ